jgi:prophage regulatory protein
MLNIDKSNTGGGQLPSRTPPALPAEGFVSIKQVLTVLPICRSAWYVGIKKGIYPKQVRHRTRSLWRVEDIRELLAKISSSQDAS